MTTQQILNTLTSLQSELTQADWVETEPLRDRILEVIELMGSIATANSGQAVDSQKLEKIASAIRKTESLDSLLNTTVLELKKVLDVSRALVYRFDNQKSGVVAAEALVRGFTPMMGETIPLEGFGLEKSNQEASYYYKQINNIEEANLTPYQNQMMERYQIKASASVPILFGDGVWGLLVVQQCARERNWLDGEITLLDAVAQELTVQLQVDGIRQQLNKQNKRDKTLSAIVNRIRDSLDIQQLFDTTVKEIRRFMNADRVGVFMFYPDAGFDDGEFVAEDVVNGYPSAIKAKIHDHCFGDQYADKYANGKVQAVNDIYNSGLSDCHIDILSDFEIKANLIVPLLKNRKLWGLLAVHQCSAPREWQEEDIDFIKQVATQFGVALQQKETLKKLENQSKQLEQRFKREKTLSSIIDKVRQSLDLQQLFDITVREIRRFMDADRVGVFMFYPDAGFDDGEFVAEDVVGGYPSAIKNKIHDHCFGNQYADKYANGKIQAVTDIYNAGLSDCHIDVLSDYEIKANLIVPLIKNKELWGLLAVHQCSAPREWQSEEIEFIQQVAVQFGVALQQAEALKQSQQQLQREKTLSTIVEKIRKSLDLQELFNTTVKEVRRYIKADRVAVFEFYPETNFDEGEFVAEDVDANYPSAVKEKIFDHCFGDQYADKYADGYVQSVADIYEEGLLSDCHIEILAKFDIRANLIVPLIRNKELWGLMAVHQCSAPRQWKQEEIEFIQQVAAQFGVALQQAESLKQTQQQLRREQAIQEIVTQVRQNIDIQLIFNSTCREVRQFLDADRVGIFKFDPDSDYNYGEFIAEDVLNEYTSAVKARVKDHCFASKYADKRQMWISVTNDVEKSDLQSCHKAILGKFEVKANLVIPLFTGNELWGLFAIHQCAAPRKWQTEEIEFGKQVASQLGIALQQREYLRQVEERNADLDRISKLDQEIIKIIEKLPQNKGNVADFFNYATRQVRQLLKCDRVSVYKFLPDWSGVYIAESVGSDWVPLVGPDIKTVWEDTHLQETKGGRYAKGETYVVNNIYEMGHKQCHVDILEQFQVKAYLLAPIFSGNKLWGILGAYQNDDFRHWKKDEADLITKLGIQLGVGIQQAEYIENLQKTSEAEQALTNISNRIRQVTNLEMDGTLSNIVAEARNLLKCDRVAIIKFGKDCSQKSFVESVSKGWMPWVTSKENKIFTDDNLQETNLKVYRQGSPVVANDIYAKDYPQCYIEVLEEAQVKSYVTASIFVDGELWGWFGTYQNGEARNWKDYEINIIEKFAAQTGVAIEQIQNFQELQGKNAQLALSTAIEQGITRVNEKIRQADNLDNIFRNVLPEMRNLLKCDRLGVYQFYPDWSGEFIAESVDSKWVPVVGEGIKTVWEDEHLQQTQGGRYRNNETFAVDNVYTIGHQKCHVDILEQFQVKSYIIAPIFAGTKLWGLLGAYQNEDFRHWNETEIQLITRLGNQLGLGIQQVEYIDQLQKNNQKLALAAKSDQVLGRISEKARQAQTFDEVYASLLSDARNLLNCDRAAVVRFNQDWSQECLAESVSKEWMSWVTPSGNKIFTDDDLQDTQAKAYRQGKPIVANDIYKMGYPQCYVEVLEEAQVKSYVVASVYVNQKLWGWFGVYQNDQARHWQDFEINAVNKLAIQLGLGIEQVQYIQELEAKNKSLAAAASQEKALARAIDKIRQSDDLDSVFRSVLPDVRGVLKCDRISVYKFLPDWSGEYIAESVGSEWVPLVGENITTIWEDTHLQDTKGGRYANGETYVANSIYEMGHLQCHVDVLEQFQVQAYIIAPIFAGKKLWGLLAAYQNTGARQWTQSEADLITRLGSQFGIGVQQSEYVKQLQANTQESAKKANRESSIIRFSARLVETLNELIQQNQDSQAIFKFATRELRRILKCDRVGVFRFNPDWSGEFITESVDSEYIPLVGTELARISDTYLQENKGGRYARKESLAVPDIYNAGHTDCHVELLEKWGTKAYAIAPIFQGDKLWGLFGIYQNSSIRHWETSEVAILEQVGTQIGITLQLSEYFNQVQQQEQQLQTSAQKEKEAREQLQMEALKMLRALQPSFQGDLTVRAPLSETELGTIADGYNTTITSLRELVKQVKDAAVKVGETSDQSSFSVTQLSSQAQQQASQMKDALQQLQAMVRATEAVASNAQKVEQAVQDANKTVSAGDSMMERTVDEMLEIRETVSQTAKKIKRLGESSQKISKVVNLIENFATQTNLLALNAAIEATRAGEYGKGFAVVADEVRSLAYQSANATTEIERFVQDIQKEINEVTEAMEVGISQVVKGSDLVDETRSSLSAIVTATNEISSLVAGISKTTTDQSQQSQTLTSAMTEVSQVAQKTSESSMQISESFRKLLTTSQDLQTSVSKFKVD